MARTSVFLALLLQVSALRIEQKKQKKRLLNAPQEKLTEKLSEQEMGEQKIAEQLFKAETTTVSDNCKANAQGIVGKQCQDPWYKTQQCKNAFQVPGYRIGDAYRLRGPFNTQQLQPYLKSHFPESVAAKYVVQHTRNRDAQTLMKIIDGPEYKNFERPPRDALVVHLRLGDILHYSKEYDIAKRHLKNETYYAPKIEIAKQKGIKSAVLVTGDHQLQQMAGVDANHAEIAEKSTKEVDEAMKKFRALFEKAGMKVTTRKDYNADCDLVYMANSRYFAKGSGQFTQTIAELVQMKGGEVL